MRLPRFRLHTLMIVVAIVALDLGGLMCGVPEVCALCLIATVFSPIVALLAYLARRVGINTLFR